MTKSPIKAAAATLTALIVAVFLSAAPLSAQATDTGTMGTGTTGTMGTTGTTGTTSGMGTDQTTGMGPTGMEEAPDDDNDREWGWLGLLGLAGLAGMRKKNNDHARTTTTTGTGTGYDTPRRT